jgi:hypothetical protein
MSTKHSVEVLFCPVRPVFERAFLFSNIFRLRSRVPSSFVTPMLRNYGAME